MLRMHTRRSYTFGTYIYSIIHENTSEINLKRNLHIRHHIPIDTFKTKTGPLENGPVISFSFGQFDDSRHLFTYFLVVFPDMRPQTVGAVLDAGFCIEKTAATLISKTIQRAIAEQAAEGFRIRTGMAGKILAFPVLKKIVICHSILLYSANIVHGQTKGGSSVNSIFSPVAGCVKERQQDHRAISQGSSNVEYFRSPTSGRPRLANCTRI